VNIGPPEMPFFDLIFAFAAGHARLTNNAEGCSGRVAIFAPPE